VETENASGADQPHSSERTLSDGSVARVLAILEEVCGAAEPPTQIEIARARGIARSTVSDILAALRQLGYVKAVDRRYEAGPQLIALGQAATRISQLRLRMRRKLEALAAATGETVALFVESGATDSVVGVLTWVDFVESNELIRYVPQPGPQPMYPSASGRVLIAFSGRDSSFLPPALLVRRTPHTVLDTATIDRQLATVRLRGYAISQNEGLDGVTAIAGPVFASDGRAEAAVSIIGPSDRLRHPARDVWPALKAALEPGDTPSSLLSKLS
jgi:IclR family transcriptional regulator, acetate operon repressor